MTLEGYASLFGAADQIGDIVRAGAFRGLATPVPMLVRHEPRLAAGRWIEAREDGRGLFVRGRIEDDQPGAALARRLIAAGLDGLSIGFRARRARARSDGGGRELLCVDLIEISLVEVPMLAAARLRPAPAATL